MDTTMKVELKSNRTGSVYQAGIYKKEMPNGTSDYVILHKSLKRIFFELGDQRPEVKMEPFDVSRWPGIPPLFAMKCTMGKLEAIGELTGVEWENSLRGNNLIKAYNPIAICSNRAFDKAFIQYMQFIINIGAQCINQGIYSSSEMSDMGGMIALNEDVDVLLDERKVPSNIVDQAGVDEYHDDMYQEYNFNQSPPVAASYPQGQQIPDQGQNRQGVPQLQNQKGSTACPTGYNNNVQHEQRNMQGQDRQMEQATHTPVGQINTQPTYRNNSASSVPIRQQMSQNTQAPANSQNRQATAIPQNQQAQQNSQGRSYTQSRSASAPVQSRQQGSAMPAGQQCPPRKANNQNSQPSYQQAQNVNNNISNQNTPKKRPEVFSVDYDFSDGVSRVATKAGVLIFNPVTSRFEGPGLDDYDLPYIKTEAEKKIGQPLETFGGLGM